MFGDRTGCLQLGLPQSSGGSKQNSWFSYQVMHDDKRIQYNYGGKTFAFQGRESCIF